MGGGGGAFFLFVFSLFPGARAPALSHFSLPSHPSQGCQALIAVETARLDSPPSPTSPYWD